MKGQYGPYIKYNSSTMHVTDTLEESGEETLFFEIYNDVDYEHASNQNTWLNYCNNLTGYYFYNENDSTLHKVISHEINRKSISSSATMGGRITANGSRIRRYDVGTRGGQTFVDFCWNPLKSFRIL